WDARHLVADGSGRLYSADAQARIAVWDRHGWLQGRVGGLERDEGPFRAAPTALAVAPDGRSLVAVDRRQYAFIRFDLTSRDWPWTRIGKRGENNGEFHDPSAVAVDGAGRIFVADRDNHNVSVFGADGSFLFRFGSYERGRAGHELVRPELMAVAPDGSACYIYDARHYEVQKFALTGQGASHVTNYGGRGSEHGRLSRPVGMGCDRLGLLYLLDTGRDILQLTDFRGKSGVVLQELTLEELDAAYATGLGVQPDGMPQILRRAGVTGLRW
ncbi:MAG: NHL repeat-containing protein, partial [Planctomycetota bacterium]